LKGLCHLKIFEADYYHSYHIISMMMILCSVQLMFSASNDLFTVVSYTVGWIYY